MAKYLMMGKYSLEAIKGIKKERTKKVVDIIKKAGGRVIAMYVLLGKYDLAFVVDFPGMKELVKASITITKLTGISFASYAAMTVEEFDKLMG